ncbi:tRNA (guanosine(46)-N7)-methyltransferase TrmB [Pantoea sp. Nvir]|uniref:tRNA (guanosine(46)-N7)-methyltransferase TrmB n=1 Tax=Pantoea sp. Nvir TaxID=2576760 RepID=UPI0013591460|nr:tRNA (guanosine(46)-N7)-methyltransferase TrmB [Pantoea sp. Nvir]MXP66763.1 tRNA (guanosine(46)-N7)-methyltransferase TrmB [Pantoea sp. Nvir]CAJ0990906.1 tRNA (guanine-N(7)-)-methyltransferase [Pantoea sp. Nvir]
MINNVITSEFDNNGLPLRRIRSFVRRQRRLTKRQQLALDKYWPEMGIEFQPEILDMTRLFRRNKPVVLEIGFGMGDSLVTMAQNNPQQNFFGIEVHAPGVGSCLASAKEKGVENLRLIYHDAVEVFEKMISDNSLSVVQLFFPDPWHKARHNKRRIVQVPFAKMVMHKLKIGGVFHIATDWEIYAKHMLEVMNNIDGYKNNSKKQEYITYPQVRPVTKFEQRGQQLGHGIWDLIFERVK